MPYQEHKSEAASIIAGCAIITLSDTRTEADDTSGGAIRRLVTSKGHTVVEYQIIRDEPGLLDPMLARLFARTDVDVVLTNGGTGVSKRDCTISVVQRRLDVVLPGFGELFRMLSWQEIASGAMASRALGGVARGKLVFAMPGSTAAVELAMNRLILPELGHLLHQLRK